MTRKHWVIQKDENRHLAAGIILFVSAVGVLFGLAVGIGEFLIWAKWWSLLLWIPVGVFLIAWALKVMIRE